MTFVCCCRIHPPFFFPQFRKLSPSPPPPPPPPIKGERTKHFLFSLLFVQEREKKKGEGREVSRDQPRTSCCRCCRCCRCGRCCRCSSHDDDDGGDGGGDGGGGGGGGGGGSGSGDDDGDTQIVMLHTDERGSFLVA